MAYVVNVANPFVVQVKDSKQRRMVIAKQAWEEEQLEEGDYIEVTIKKINLSNK
jgi:hypothetical protein